MTQAACAAVVLRFASRRGSYKIIALKQSLSFEDAYADGGPEMARVRRESKFEVFGQEMLEKVVAKSGSSGRVYLPPDWIGKRVKVIRVERGAADAGAVRSDGFRGVRAGRQWPGPSEAARDGP